MTEIRCKKCKRLLMKEIDNGAIRYMPVPQEAVAVFDKPYKYEVQCPKCKYVNKI